MGDRTETGHTTAIDGNLLTEEVSGTNRWSVNPGSRIVLRDIGFPISPRTCRVSYFGGRINFTEVGYTAGTRKINNLDILFMAFRSDSRPAHSVSFGER